MLYCPETAVLPALITPPQLCSETHLQQAHPNENPSHPSPTVSLLDPDTPTSSHGVLYSQWTPHNITGKNPVIIYTLSHRIPHRIPNINLLLWQENTHQIQDPIRSFLETTLKSGTAIMSKYKSTVSNDPHFPTRLRYLLMKHPKMSSVSHKTHVTPSAMLGLYFTLAFSFFLSHGFSHSPSDCLYSAPYRAHSQIWNKDVPCPGTELSSRAPGM